jgi:hypothetical protein
LPPDESPAGGEGYEYGGGACPPDEPPAGGGGYEYGGYPYGRSGGYRYGGGTPVEPSTEGGGVEGIDREDSDMVEVEVVEREHEGVVLVRHCVEVVFTSLSTAPLLEQPVKVRCLEGLRIIGFKLSGNTVDTRIYVVRAAEA